MDTNWANQPWQAAKSQLLRLATDTAARDALLLVFSGVVNGAGGFVFWFVAAHLYSTTVVGIGSAGSAIVTLLAGVSGLGFGVGMIRYGSALGPRYRHRLFGIFLVTLAAGCVAGIVFWRLVPVLARGLEPAFSLSTDVAIFVASCALTALSLQYDSFLLSRRLLSLLIGRNLFLVVSRTVLILLLPIKTPAMLIGTVGISAASSMAATMLLNLFRQSRPHQSIVTPVAIPVLIRFSLWNCLTGLAQTMSNFLMPTIVISITDATQGAAFYMAWSLFGVLLLIPTALSYIVLVEKSAKVGPAADVDNNAGQRGALMVLITVLFIPMAILILRVLGRTYFVDGAAVLLTFTLGIWPNLKAQLLVTKMRLHGSQGVLAAIYMTNQLAVIGGSVALLRIAGVAGAALSWALGQILLLLALQWASRRSRTGGAIWVEEHDEKTGRLLIVQSTTTADKP